MTATSATTAISWPDTYAEVAERLVSQAPSARLIFTGTSACVDAIFRIDDSRHFVMFDQPARFDAALDAFLAG